MSWFGRRRSRDAEPIRETPVVTVDIDATDPLIPYLISAGRPIDVDDLHLSSPAVEEMKRKGIAVLVPMVSQGELISVLQLGRRLSDQPYTTDDMDLLASIAGGAAPAMRLAQLLQERAAEAAERERVASELRVAQLIQQHFLPRKLPVREGWAVEAFYRSAREVGGDFYDFIDFEDGRLGIVVGDVTDKGVPAALVMTSARTLLRAAAQRLVEPSEVLARVNSQLADEIPERMFVTCLYGVLDTATGRFRFANAGHNLPAIGRDHMATEAKATGMPLGLMAGTIYEETDIEIGSGDALILYSDALPEAHDPSGAMYGFDRVLESISHLGEGSIVDQLMDDLSGFTGENWDQEDDITIVSVVRGSPTHTETERRLEIPSVPGNERQAIEWVAGIVGGRLSEDRLERLKTAVGEATMNAIEHGNQNDPSVPVEVVTRMNSGSIVVRIVDQGEGPLSEPRRPDLDAKLRGEESPRGWGLFLMEEMVDQVTAVSEGGRHVIEMVMATEEAAHE